MKRQLFIAGCLVFCFIGFLAANADDSRPIFADPQGGVVWMSDADFVISSGFSSSLRMPRYKALEFIRAMNRGEVVNYSFTDWRLPTGRELRRYLEVRGEKSAATAEITQYVEEYEARQGMAPRDWSFRAFLAPDEAIALPVRGQGLPADFQNVAVFATNSIHLQQSSDILSGDVIANDASPGPFLSEGRELVVGKAVTTPAGYRVVGDSIKIKTNGVVGGSIEYNDLVNNGPSDPPETTPIPVLPIFGTLPPFHEVPSRPDAPDITVQIGGSIDLDAGDYGLLKVKKNGTVTFTGGIYNFREIDSGISTELLFQAPSEVRVEGKFSADQNSYIGSEAGFLAGGPPFTPAAPFASEIIFYVAGINGNNGNLGATPKAAKIGISADSFANFYVPNGTLHLRQNTAATGAFLARDVNVGKGVQVTLDSFFLENRPPVALPNAVITDGTDPLVITLTGVDPESETLLFSLVAPNPINGTLSALTQVPLSNATVTYTAFGSGDLQDSFGFRVTDPGGLSGVTVVDINVPDPAIPPELTNFVVAKNDSIETLVGPATVDISLVAFADVADPSAVGDIAFSIVSGPTAGTLTTPVPSEPTATDLAPPVPEELFASVRSATATYTPPVTAGTDSFDFQACTDLNDDGDTADAGECDIATVTIDFAAFTPPVAPVAENQSVATEMDAAVEINLTDGSGEGSGEPGTGRSLWGAKDGPESDSNNPGARTDYLFLTALTVDGGWTFFNDCDLLGNPCPDGPFTFSIASGGACVSVTDAFLKSDEYTVADNSVVLGATSAGVPDDSVSQTDPDLAFADPDYSSGSFVVGSGSHSIDVTRNAGLPGLAAAFIRVDSAGTAFCAAFTNLTASSFGAPTTADLGEVIGGQILVTVTNTGTVDIAAGTLSSIGFYVSTDSVITTADTLLIGGRENLATSAPSGLAVGASITDFLFTGASINTASPSGNVFIGVLVDEFDAIAESDETDNTASLPILIGPPQPDLVVSSLTHDPANPTNVNDIDFTAVVKNVGNASAGASTLSFRIDSLSHPESPSDTAALWSVGALEPGESQTIVRSEGIPDAEAVTVTAVADFNDDVAELDENNNTSIDTFTVAEAVEATQLFATITSLPASGTLVDSTGTTITSVPMALPNTMVTFVPATGFTGTTAFVYMITDPGTGLISDTALVDLSIGLLLDCVSDFDDCDHGRP